MSDVTAGLLQREEQLKRVAISLMIRGAGSVLAFSVVFASTRNLAAAVLTMAAVWLAVLLFYDLHNVRALISPAERLFRIDRSELRRLFLLGLPLGWVATFASLNANIPRYFLQHYLGLADQGIYASLAYLAIGMGLAVFALTQSVTTRLARLYEGRDVRGFLRLLLRLSMLGVLTIVVGVPASFLLGKPFLTLVYRPDYADHVGLLALFVATSGVTTISAFVFCGMSAARLFRVQLPVYLMTVTVCAASAAILIPRFGLNGAGLAVLISSITTCIGGMWVISRALRKQARTAEISTGTERHGYRELA
jgi:O-antigen/teichoic acid export membrane protein